MSSILLSYLFDGWTLMVKIRQHGDNGEIFDIRNFSSDLAEFIDPVTWTIDVRECLGERSEEIMDISEGGVELIDESFRRLYFGIYQTIDGMFEVVGRTGTVNLLAVDSSFWEVTSEVSGFEDHMLRRYGAFD